MWIAHGYVRTKSNPEFLKKMHPIVTLEDINRSIKLIKSLIELTNPLNSEQSEQVSTYLKLLLFYYPHFNCQFDIPIFRGRIGAFSNIKDIGVPPSQFVSKFGRFNLPHQQILYACSELGGPIVELLNNEFDTSNTEITTLEFRPKDKDSSLFVIPIGLEIDDFAINPKIHHGNDSKEFRILVGDQLRSCSKVIKEKYDSKYIKFYTIVKTFIRSLAREVSSNENSYRVLNLLSEQLLQNNEQAKGVIYNSVFIPDINYMNFALDPSVLSSMYLPHAAKRFKIEMFGNGMMYYTTHNSSRIDTNGNISWDVADIENHRKQTVSMMTNTTHNYYDSIAKKTPK